MTRFVAMLSVCASTITLLTFLTGAYSVRDFVLLARPMVPNTTEVRSIPELWLAAWIVVMAGLGAPVIILGIERLLYGEILPDLPVGTANRLTYFVVHLAGGLFGGAVGTYLGAWSATYAYRAVSWVF